MASEGRQQYDDSTRISSAVDTLIVLYSSRAVRKFGTRSVTKTPTYLLPGYIRHYKTRKGDCLDLFR